MKTIQRSARAGRVACSIVICLVLTAGSLLLPRLATAGDEVQVVYHADFSDPRRFSAMLTSINNMMNFYENELVEADVRIVFVAHGIRFVTEMCKMRAFVDLWDEILSQRYGVEDPKFRRFRYGVQVNSLGLLRRALRPWVREWPRPCPCPRPERSRARARRGRGTAYINCPPSTLITWPVTWRASSEQRTSMHSPRGSPAFTRAPDATRRPPPMARPR